MKNRQRVGNKRAVFFLQAHEQIQLACTTIQKHTEEPISDFLHASRRTHQNEVARSERDTEEMVGNQFKWKWEKMGFEISRWDLRRRQKEGKIMGND